MTNIGRLYGGSYVELTNIDSAHYWFKLGVKYASNDPYPLRSYAEFLNKNNETKEALKYINMAISTNKTDWNLLINARGDILVKMNLIEDAKTFI